MLHWICPIDYKFQLPDWDRLLDVLSIKVTFPNYSKKKPFSAHRFFFFIALLWTHIASARKRILSFNTLNCSFKLDELDHLIPFVSNSVKEITVSKNHCCDIRNQENPEISQNINTHVCKVIHSLQRTLLHSIT